jgi:transmembrane sensor
MKRSSPQFDTDPRLEAASAWCLRLADGTLPADEQIQLDAWLRGDPENRKAFEDAVGIWQAVGETSLTPELLALRRDALTSFEGANRVRWQGRARRKWNWVPAAAAASLLLVVGGSWSVVSWLIPTDYRTGVGERRIVVLNDGSKVSLDALTEVKIRYTAGARRLWLEHGRAEFEVAKDIRRPFTVAAADKLVRATGTAFSVELIQGQVQVVLYQGHVAVFSDDKGAAPERLILQTAEGAGTQTVQADAVLTPGNELIAPVRVASDQLSPIPLASARVIPTDPIRSLAWEGGQLVFASEPLASAVERVNRYSDRKLIIGDSRIAAIKIDGVFTAGDTEAFVDGVTGVFPVEVRDTAEGKVLVSRP